MKAIGEIQLLQNKERQSEKKDLEIFNTHTLLLIYAYFYGNKVLAKQKLFVLLKMLVTFYLTTAVLYFLRFEPTISFINFIKEIKWE